MSMKDLENLYDWKRDLNDLPDKLKEKLYKAVAAEVQKDDFEAKNEELRQKEFEYESQRIHNLRHYLICLRHTKLISQCTFKRSIKKLRKLAVSKGIAFL